MQGVSKMVAILAVAVLASGCVGGAAIESKYEDADTRFGNKFAGGKAEDKLVEIPAGTAKLTVKAAWDIAGGGTFVLSDPTGRPVKNEEVGGSGEGSGEWYSVQNPKSGSWRLSISVGGSGAYSFGFYY